MFRTLTHSGPIANTILRKMSSSSLKRSAPTSSPTRTSPRKQAPAQDASSSSSPARKRGKTGDALTDASPAAAANASGADDFDAEFNDADVLIAAAEDFDAHPEILAAADKSSAPNSSASGAGVSASAKKQTTLPSKVIGQKGSSNGTAAQASSESAMLNESDHLAMEKKYMGKEWFEKLEDEMRKESFIKVCVESFLRYFDAATESASLQTAQVFLTRRARSPQSDLPTRAPNP